MVTFFKTIVLFILWGFVLVSFVDSIAPDWKPHDKSTLKLLQIVHRHGERSVLKNNIPKTDPYKHVSHWPAGYGELTNEGKARMYRIGTYLREWYTGYLKDYNSPRLVYARSSLEHRCIESVSSLLAGMYPPNGNWTWGDTKSLGQLWQPFPIETFMPKDDDTVLVPHKKCPKSDDEYLKIKDSDPVKKIMLEFKNSTMYNYMVKELFNESIDYLYRGQQFWDTLKIEQEHKLIWPNLTEGSAYNQSEVVKALEPLGIGSYMWDWNTPFTLKIRLGKLIEILIANMKSKIKGQTSEEFKELYIYSTHDSIVVPLMQTQNIYNNMTPPYGGSLLIELHELSNHSYNVQVYYYNETGETGGEHAKQPFLLLEQNFDEFESKNKKWLYSDFNKECGIAEDNPKLILSEMTFMVIGIAIGIGLLGLNIFAFKYIRARRHSFRVSK